MFNYLSIDWGSKYFGLAFGSDATNLVVPYSKVIIAKDIWVELEDILTSRDIQFIILGVPTNFKLQPTNITAKVQDFEKELHVFLDNIQKSKIEVKTFNERNTTSNSILNNRKLELTTNKQNVDNLSAMNLLKEYFKFGG